MPAARAGLPASAPGVVRAGPASTAVLSQVIAEAFHDLDVSRWLLPGPAVRRRIFPSYFQLLAEHATTQGLVYTTPGQDAVALWLPAGHELPAPPPGYADRMTAITSPWTGQFRVFDAVLDKHHPSGQPHHYLAILAVRPGQQGCGTGSALLTAHHAVLDQERIPAYLAAASPRARDLYLRHDYQIQPGPLIQLPDGPRMWPMWREPQPAAAAPGQEQG